MKHDAHNPVSLEKEIVREKIVAMLHAEIKKRYNIPHLSGIPQITERQLLTGLSDNHIDHLYDLFTTTIYPPPDTRRSDRDRSFSSLIRLLKSPHKLTFLIPSLPRIMMKYATHFPTAMKAGLSTILAYNLSLRLENRMVDALHEYLIVRNTPITPGLTLTDGDFRHSYFSIPQSDGRKMITLAINVMRAGKRRGIVKATREILVEVQNSLAAKDRQLTASGRSPEHSDDIAAIDYGKIVLDKFQETFGGFDEPTMERLIEISYITEIDYLERMHGAK